MKDKELSEKLDMIAEQAKLFSVLMMMQDAPDGQLFKAVQLDGKYKGEIWYGKKVAG